MFWQQLINGLTLGSSYALIALGYTMVYGIVQLINFAHGDVFMIGAFAGLFMVTVLKVNLLVAVVGAMAFCMLLGVIIERIAYRPLRAKGSRLSALISAIGVSIFLSTLVSLIRGPSTTRYPASAFPQTQVNLGFIHVSNIQVWILILTAVIMILLQLLVHRTRMGKAMRACSEDLDAARLMGVNANGIISFTFALGSALAAIGGVMVGIYYNAVFPTMGLMVGLKAFAAAVLGGIGSIPGALVGGLILGTLEIFGVAYLASSYKDAIAFGILILVLLLRPQGILGKPVTKKV